MKTGYAILLGIVSLIITVPAFAHHSFAAEFDETKPIALSGIVSKIEWGNPHVYFYIDVKDDKGNVVTWGVESQSVGELLHSGWTRGSLKIGDQVKAQGFVAKDGSHLIGARLVTLPDGRKIFTGAAGDGGPGDPRKQP
jgi:hypothetical protein